MIRDERKKHAKQKKSVIDKVESQCKEAKSKLQSKHRQDVTTLVLEHYKALNKIKAKAKKEVKAAKVRLGFRDQGDPVLPLGIN